MMIIMTQVEKQFTISILIIAIIVWTKIGQLEALESLFFGKPPASIVYPVQSKFGIEDGPDCGKSHAHSKDHAPVVFKGSKGFSSDIWHLPMPSPMVMDKHMKYDEHEHEHEDAADVLVDYKKDDHYHKHDDDDDDHHSHYHWQAWKNVLTKFPSKYYMGYPAKSKVSYPHMKSAHHGGKFGGGGDFQQKIDYEPEAPKPKPHAKTYAKTTTETPIVQQQIFTQGPIVQEIIQQTTEAPSKGQHYQEQHQQVTEPPTKDIPETKFAFHDEGQLHVKEPLHMLFDEKVYNHHEEKGFHHHDHSKGGHNQYVMKDDDYHEKMKKEFFKMVQHDYQKAKNAYMEQVKIDDARTKGGKKYQQPRKFQQMKEEQHHTKGGDAKGGQKMMHHEQMSKSHDHGQQMAKGQVHMKPHGPSKQYQSPMEIGKYEQMSKGGDHGGGQQKIEDHSSIKGGGFGGHHATKGGEDQQQMKEPHEGGQTTKGGEDHQQMKYEEHQQMTKGGQGEHQKIVDDGGETKGGDSPTKGGEHPKKGGGFMQHMKDAYEMKMQNIDGQQQQHHHQVKDDDFDKTHHGFDHKDTKGGEIKGGDGQQAKGGDEQKPEKWYGHRMTPIKDSQQQKEEHYGQRQQQQHDEDAKKGGDNPHKHDKQMQIQVQEKHQLDSSFSNVVETSASQRTRESFSNAADFARQMTARYASASNDSRQVVHPNAELGSMNIRSDSLASLPSSGLETRMGARRTGNESPINTSERNESFGTRTVSSQLFPKYLGLGELQKHEGSNRTQARLSCQFADPGGKNVSIWNVEWFKFDGDYDAKRQPPSFECSPRCHLSPIHTDIMMTIHPGSTSMVQNYPDGLATNYLLTIHEIDESHIGAYRCSAMRQSDGKTTELVYRVITLE